MPFPAFEDTFNSSTPVTAPLDEAASGFAPAQPGKPQNDKKRKAPLVVAACIGFLLLIAAAIAALVLLPSPGRDSSTVIHYGSTELLAVNPNTRIIAHNSSGESINDYQIILIPSSNNEGTETTTVEEYHVQGAEGFSFADLPEVPTGTYDVTIVDNEKNEEYQLPPIHVDPENEAPDKVVVEQDPENPVHPTPHLTDMQKAEALYWKKYVELSSAHGQPAAKSAHSKRNSSAYAYAEGLGFAKLVDFDADGLDELVIAYYDQSKDIEASLPDGDEGLTPYGYTLEVWSYQPQSESLVCLYQQNPLMHANGYEAATFDLAKFEGRPCIVEWSFDSSVDSNKITIDLAAMNKGAFETAKSYEALMATGTYAIDGKEASEAEYQTAVGTWLPSVNTYAMSALGDHDAAPVQEQGYAAWAIAKGTKTSNPPEECVRVSEETREHLRKSVEASKLADPDALPHGGSQTSEVQGAEGSSNAAEAQGAEGSAPPASETAPDPTPQSVTVQDDYYAVTLPEAWTGKVEAIPQGGGVTAVNLAGTDLPLITVHVVDAARPRIDGDIAAGCLWSAEGSLGKRVEVHARNYAYLALEYQRLTGSNDQAWPGATEQQKEEILALTTGGTVNLANLSNYNVSNIGLPNKTYLETSLFPAITVN